MAKATFSHKNKNFFPGNGQYSKNKPLPGNSVFILKTSLNGAKAGFLLLNGIIFAYFNDIK